MAATEEPTRAFLQQSGDATVGTYVFTVSNGIETKDATLKIILDKPVGGTVELLAGGSDAPARPAGGSGPSVPYAAIAGGAAAAALAALAGGWYARRRFGQRRG